MKLEKLPSGSYRVRKTYKKKIYSIVFDHKPTQKELTLALAEKLESMGATNPGTFEQKALEYMRDRKNCTSAATIGGYKKILRQMSEEFKSKDIYDMDEPFIQAEVNRYAQGRAPKTVKNFYGLITAVLRHYRPKIALTVTLPKPKKYKAYLPKKHEVKAILESVKGTNYSVPFQLGTLGMRRSEICAVELSDLYQDDEGDYFLTIEDAYVYDENNKPIIQDMNKTTASTRDIYIPKPLAEEIMQKGFIFDKQPSNLLRVLHQKQRLLNIPEFRFHDLRHYYASYAHAMGVPDAYIKSSGGWVSDYVMKQIYIDEMEEEKKKNQKSVASSIL